ncbi:hypothetical protein [Microbulbifer sp. JSM ZJ756]|uniref:hypothetical protein n=1 Tax=Microbulbifer sp. JSM ZJ756 TaxID=3376191 RepID=UPI0037A0EFA9
MAKAATYLAPFAGFVSAVAGQLGEFIVAYGGFCVGVGSLVGMWYWNEKRYQLEKEHKRWLREQASNEQDSAGQS